jgi:hypothetical protein
MEIKKFKIESMDDVAMFFIHLVFDDRIDLNLDTPMEDYVDREGNPTFSKEDAAYYQELMDKCREVVEEYGKDIYVLTMRVLGLKYYCSKGCDNLLRFYDKGISCDD